jgi:hypothetical protein
LLTSIVVNKKNPGGLQATGIFLGEYRHKNNLATTAALMMEQAYESALTNGLL